MRAALPDVDIIVKAFLRPQCVRRLVDSIIDRYPHAHLAIADDGDPDPAMREYYEQLTADGHEILLLPFDVGISAGRNALVDATTRPYLLLLDDDFVFTSQTRIETFVEILEAERSIGVVGGSLLDRAVELRSWEFTIRIEDGLVQCHPVKRQQRLIAGHVCYDAQIVNNFALFRREVFDSVRWDPVLKTKEHEDFFLRLGETPWKVVHCPSVVADHMLELPASYERFRMRDDGERRFHQKWGTTGFRINPPDDARGDRRWRRRVYASAVAHSARDHRPRKALLLMYTAARSEVGRFRRMLGRALARQRAGS